MDNQRRNLLGLLRRASRKGSMGRKACTSSSRRRNGSVLVPSPHCHSLPHHIVAQFDATPCRQPCHSSRSQPLPRKSSSCAKLVTACGTLESPTVLTSLITREPRQSMEVVQ